MPLQFALYPEPPEVRMKNEFHTNSDSQSHTRVFYCNFCVGYVGSSVTTAQPTSIQPTTWLWKCYLSAQCLSAILE